MVHFEEDRGEPSRTGSRGRLAPVTPIFGAGGGAGVVSGAVEPEPVGADETSAAISPESAAASAAETEAESAREDAERILLRKLRTRSLSVKEARAVVGAGGAVDSDGVEGIIADFERRGYLDDAALAGQLVTSGVERKGQGRQVIAQTLAKRGIPREVADAALSELPDDDAERALDFARQKARSMGRLDRDAALRRLHGQLARRGFPGSIAMTAARQALDEAAGSGSGVRFG